MEVFNLEGEQDWDAENDREGFRHRATRVGDRLGARALGAGLYELPPGEKTWPYHYTYGMEEWLLVVSGTPTQRAPRASASSCVATSSSSVKGQRAPIS